MARLPYADLGDPEARPLVDRIVAERGYGSYVEVEIFSQRNWWQRDPDDVIGVIKERAQTAV